LRDYHFPKPKGRPNAGLKLLPMSLNFLILRLWKLIHVLFSGRYKALRHGVAPSIEHKKSLAGLDFDFVVDVGANRGQFAWFARQQFHEARIVSFEPLTGPAKIFEKIFAGDPKVKLVRAAIAERNGTVIINVTDDDDSSSPLEITAKQAEHFGSKIVTQCTAICGPLSHFIRTDDFGARNLLKIDTQGYELEVLKGSVDLLDRFDAIYCEVSYLELYKGQALATDVICYLSNKQFQLAGVYNQVNVTRDGALQADMLFFKRW
jgi:FkbM family methyltransferase